MPSLVVLVVDDDTAFSALLGELLCSDDCTVERAANGREALAMLDRIRPHLIVTDLVMPVMDGWQLVRELKRDRNYSAIPLVVISALAKDVPDGVAFCIDKNALLDRLADLLTAP